MMSQACETIDIAIVDEGGGESLDSCYSAAEVSHDRDQVRFTITEVTGNWHGPVPLQRVMQSLIAGLLDNLSK